MDNLQTISEDGKPPVSRVKDCQSAQQIWETLRRSDALSSYYRAQIDAAYNDERPYNEGDLQRNNQGYRVNVSWGFAASVLESAMAGYVDIINATSTLFECPTTYGNPAEREELERGVEEEVSNTIRSWEDFFNTYLALCAPFIKHGVSVAMFKDEFNWQFATSDLSDFKIPRKTKVGQTHIDVGCCLRFYSPTELYKLIEDPQVARDLGYNVKACRHAIIHSVQNNNTFSTYRQYDWEKLEIELKNNDLYFSTASANAQAIRVVHMWVTEFDGRVSHYMFCDDNNQPDFLYKKVGRFSSSFEAYVVFNYGVGTDNYYHAIRGQGYKVYPIHQALNRAYCQSLELATYGSAPTFQPKDETTMQEMQFIPTGAYNLITPGVTVLKDTVAPNIATGVLPVISQFSQMFRERTSQYNSEQLINTNTEKTKFQVQAELGTIAKMSVSALNLFYDPWRILVREMVRRMKRRDYDARDPGGKWVADLKKRLLQRGNDGGGNKDRFLEAFYHLDIDRLEIVKAIGAGSEAARQVAYDRLMGIYNSLPDKGKQNLIWSIVSETVGPRNAVNFAIQPGKSETPTVDEGIAQLENNVLLMGGVVQVLDGQNNLVHARVHLAAEAPMLQQAEEGLQVDPMSVAQLLPGIAALNQHASEHIAKLTADPLLKQESAQMRKVLQEADEILHNGLLKVQKIQREQAEQAQEQGQEAPQPQIDPKVLAQLEAQRIKREQDLAYAAQKANQDMQIRQAKADQELAINDAKSAQEIRKGVLV